MAEDYIDKMLKQAEAGKLGGTLKNSRPEGTPLPRPFQMPPDKPDIPKPKSNAPKGMATSVKGDLGYYRGVEADKVFGRKMKGWGRTGACAKPLTYRKPAIEGGEGPRAV